MKTGVKNSSRTKFLWMGSADASTLHYFLQLLKKKVVKITAIKNMTCKHILYK